MTTLPGFDRPADLYECANAHGVHVGSMDKLVRFAQEILRRANNSTALSEITQASEAIGGYDLGPKTYLYAPEGSGPCAKQTVTATIVATNGDRYIGTNHCMNPQHECPRAGMPTGIGYELCKSICQQHAHAEVNAVLLAGDAASGASMRIDGHTYACESCKSVAREYGIAGIVIEEADSGND